MKDETGRHSARWLVSIAASSEAANNLSRSHSMQSACDARLQKDLKLHGVHSRARNGLEANILSGDRCRKRAACGSELLPNTAGASKRPCLLELRAGMRMEAKPQIAAHLACVHEMVYCHVAQAICSLHLGSRRCFQPRCLSKLASPNLSRPQPPGTTHTHPTFMENDYTHVVDCPLAASPFACCRGPAQKQRCRVLYCTFR